MLKPTPAPDPAAKFADIAKQYAAHKAKGGTVFDFVPKKPKPAPGAPGRKSP